MYVHSDIILTWLAQKELKDMIAALQWKAIEANLKLAESENSKVVVVGDGQQTPVVIDQ